MLNTYSSIQDHRDFLTLHKSELHSSQLKRLKSNLFRSAYHKVWKLDPQLCFDILAPLFSNTGRPAIDPAIFLRSFVLMQHFGFTSIHNWCDSLSSDSLYQYLVGSFSPPSFSSHYDFIIRLTGRDPHRDTFFKKDHYVKPPKKKPKKGEKLMNYSHTNTYYLLDKYKNGAQSDRDRMIYTLQLVFNALAVVPSIDKGFINTSNLILSGDGSSLHVHASKYGHKVNASLPDGEPAFRFSAPDADIGWDSDLETFYLGHTFYNISYHDPVRCYDLPVFTSIEKASRHDALTTLSATAQMLDINPSLHPKYMCFDSASDSLPIYQYFRHLNITPVIDHNPRRESSKSQNSDEVVTTNGEVICRSGEKMVDYGYDIQRCRRKFRCPLALGKIVSCPNKDECSSSEYGRVVYINDGDDIRNGGPLRYRSDKWKEIYKNRTSTERINNRVLNDYQLHQMFIRDEAKHAFFSIFACINIHLDAWVQEEL